MSDRREELKTEYWLLCLFEDADFRWLCVQVWRKMWYQKMKMKLIVLGIIVALILIIILSIFQGICGK